MNLDQQQEIILQLGFREAALPALRTYLDLLWQANEQLNLVSRKMSFEDLLANHVIDCLLPLSHFPRDRAKKVADFGTGGGLPVVLYALQFPEIEFHLFEKSALKCEFLRECKKLAPNLQVVGEIPQKFSGVDLVMARAFKPIDVILQMSLSYYDQGGAYFLLKGRREKIEEEMKVARKIRKDLTATLVPLKSPVLDVERHLVLIP